MSVFVSRRIPDAGLERLRAAGVQFEIGQTDGERGIEREALLDGVRRHDVLLCLLTERIDEELLRVNPGLRGVSNMAVGVDNIDLEAAERLGIPIGSTPNVLTDATADLAWALLLATARRIPEAHAYMTEGKYQAWGPELLCGMDVGPGVSARRKVLGVVGFGRIGAAVARRARGFDVDVVACTSREPSAELRRAHPEIEFVSLPGLLERSDFVSLHVPLTPETHHLIDAEALDAMKPTAVLINTARGAVVDEAALVEALRGGGIAAAGLDVFEREPETVPGLCELPNVVVLPHIGSATVSTRESMAVCAADNALRFLRG